MKRVFIVHGWGGFPGEGWQGWLAKEFRNRDIEVQPLDMPNPDWPKIDEWVPFLSEQVGKIDDEVILIGHSIGCQTIFRYMMQLPDHTNIGAVVLVAPWVNLTAAAINETPTSAAIAKPWLEALIDWQKIKPMAQSWTVIMASDDPWVPITDAEIFIEKLGVTIVRTDGRGHMSGEEGVTEMPEFLKIIDLWI